MADPGPLVGTGRAALVYDLGGDRVLRRYRRPPPPGLTEREAAVMTYLRQQGYPVPEVFDADGADLVMERLHGTTMLSDLESHPWRADRHAATWAELVGRLATVPVGDLATAGVPARFGAPDGVLHLDFHPDNVMLTPDGPVVFDWSNASLGPPAAEVAQAWIISASSSADGPRWKRAVVRVLRRRFIAQFLRASDRAGAEAILPVVAAYRLKDPNVRPEEAARIHDLLADPSD